MVKVNCEEFPQLVEAVVLWTGWGQDALPKRDDDVLIDYFGAEIAVALLPVVKSLQDDFYSSDARFVAADLHQMALLSSAQFRSKHPELADEIVNAFSWCYTFDFK